MSEQTEALMALLKEVTKLKQEVIDLKADVLLLETWCYGGDENGM